MHDEEWLEQIEISLTEEEIEALGWQPERTWWAMGFWLASVASFHCGGDAGMNKVQREVKEILKHSVLWTLYFVAILAVALVAIYT
ncbi:hypothetical protein ABMX69_16235 [Vibrio vulnificus]|uniref:hypothetical protein n=1 Tax=Vibrio vulnificus TaxID=672 RepID=UPI00187D4A6B